MSNPRYVVVESKKDGLQAIKLTEGAFSGIMYTYGKVSFDEDEVNDKVHLRFDYEILHQNKNNLFDKTSFEQYIGDILQELIHEGIEQNNLTYTGGVDENRNEDSEQSDS
jgi:hypothetical protein